MSKRRKPKKGKAKSKFPHELTIAACHSNLEEQIITDAGFDSINYQLASQYFSIDEIFNYWECYLDFSEIDVDEVESFEELANTNYYAYSEPKQAEFLELVISKFSWLPSSFDVATARAVYGSEYLWVQIITLIERYEGQNYIDSFETKAIKLGLYLKKELANPNLSVINDNKHAVSAINGIISFDRYFLKDFREFTKENKPEVFWSPRKYVKEADRLSINKATKIFAPDDDLLELDYDEFD